MSYKFGKKSLERLEECHTDLQKLMHESLKSAPCDMSIICGHRGEEDQNREFMEGDSQLKFPHSKHNSYPSIAVDVIPYPTGYNDIYMLKVLGCHIFSTAYELGIKVKWGGFWSWKDYPHWELIND